MNYKRQTIHSTRIKSEWLDYNNHMNVAYYALVFDQAGEKLVSDIGINEAFTKETGISWMVLESHVTYNNEVLVDQYVDVRYQLIDHDNKRLHLYFEMCAQNHDGTKYLASSLEQIVMCVNLKVRKSCNFPAKALMNIRYLFDNQSNILRPDNIGRTISIRHK